MDLLAQLIIHGKTLVFAATGLLGISFIITFHEFGHFLFCKLFGIHTPSFSVGMGPRLIEKKIGDTVFALSAIPIGGYVEVTGLAEADQASNSLSQKPFWQKMLVMSGGILFNMLLSYVIISLLFFCGMPNTALASPLNATTTIAAFTEDSPGKQQGLQEGDAILEIEGREVENNAAQLLELIKASPNAPVQFLVLRDGTEQMINLTTGSRTLDGQKAGSLGVSFASRALEPKSFLESFSLGAQITWSLIKRITSSFRMLLSRDGLKQVGGPVAILAESAKGAQRGFAFFWALMAIISINLGILNLLPLPILDGGQILFMTLETLAGREIPLRVREYIFYICWALMIGLMIWLTVRDVNHLRQSANHQSATEQPQQK